MGKMAGSNGGCGRRTNFILGVSTSIFHAFERPDGGEHAAHQEHRPER